MPRPEAQAPFPFTDAQLTERFKTWHRESFEQRYLFERQWLRNIWYVLNRQWIYFDSKRGQWQDKRIAKDFPKPVIPACKEVIQTVRANFSAINYGAMARPIGNDTKNIITAGVCDDYIPILHDDHQMDDVLDEFDFWLLTCGNAWLHSTVTYERENGEPTILAYETCQGCGQEFDSATIFNAGQQCPECKGREFKPTLDQETEKPKQKIQFKPRGKTIALSPFEIAYPLVYERFSLAPYVITMRWREKTYYESHPEEAMQKLAKTLPFSKSPTDRTMQIYKTLPYQNDLGIAPAWFTAGGSSTEAEGIIEYTVWHKPCEDYPEGAVIRYAGEQQSIVVHCEAENLPGPLPLKDAKNNPIFPFTHAEYDHVGGRSLGSGILDPVIPLQDLMNQTWAMVLMSMFRMANPVWIKPKGLEIPHLASAGSTPGFVVEYDPLISNGAEPKRLDGANLNAGYFTVLDRLKQMVEEATGTFDILKGQKPAGVEAYAALNLLVERGQARHASAFKSRGKAYKAWAKFALEIERAFGDETRTMSIMAPTKGWAFETFKKADLSGDVDILIEDGTQTPKTALGERAMISQLNQMRLLNPNDPDQVYKVYESFGATKLLPAMDAQKQEAWRNMEKVEQFFGNPMAVQQAAMTGQPPITYRRWYNPIIHRQEFINWCVSDRGRELIDTGGPSVALFLDAYLTQIDLALHMQQAGVLDAGGEMLQAPPRGGSGQPPPQGPGDGGGVAMQNSEQNAGGVGPQSSGAGGTAESSAQAM